MGSRLSRVAAVVAAAMMSFGVLAGGAWGAVTPGWECVPTAAGQAVVSGGTGSSPSCAAGTTAVLAPTYVSLGVGGKPTVLFAAVNVQIVNGAGTTASLNGEGNLVVGYDENPSQLSQTGSHDLILGRNHSFTGFAQLLAGFQNTASGNYATVLGRSNTAGGTYSTVTGGETNRATGTSASVEGGDANSASGEGASVTGGFLNAASSIDAFVGGGASNTASSAESSVSGGDENTATGDGSSVSGGWNNAASGLEASIISSSRGIFPATGQTC